MVNANLLRYIKNKPGTPSGSISPANKSLGTKAMDSLEESGLLPRWLERRNLGGTKAHVAGVAKGAYDLGAQGTRDLGAIATYLGNKALGRSEEEAGANVNKYYDATKFVDKPDEALTNYAYNQATPEVAAANLSRGEREGMGMATVGALKSSVKSTTAAERSAAQKAVNQLMKNPSAYSKEEAIAILNNRFLNPRIPNTTTEKALQSIGKGIDNVAQRIGNTKLFKAIDNAQVEKAAKELGVDLNELGIKNTSRARATATKKRNMSAQERAARKRAEDSANELAADRLRNEAGNTSLNDMYEYWKSQRNG